MLSDKGIAPAPVKPRSDWNGHGDRNQGQIVQDSHDVLKTTTNMAGSPGRAERG